MENSCLSIGSTVIGLCVTKSDYERALLGRSEELLRIIMLESENSTAVAQHHITTLSQSRSYNLAPITRLRFRP